MSRRRPSASQIWAGETPHFVFLGRTNRVGASRLAVEPAHEVVEGNAGLRHHHDRTKGAAQALGTGNGISIGVDGVEVGRAFVHPHARVTRFDLPSRATGHEVFARGKLGLVADERAPLGRVFFRQQNPLLADRRWPHKQCGRPWPAWWSR